MSETARLLKNVRSVFNLRATPSTTRVNTEVELRCSNEIISATSSDVYKANYNGFAFSQEEGGAVAQSEVIRAYDTNLPKPGGM